MANAAFQDLSSYSLMWLKSRAFPVWLCPFSCTEKALKMHFQARENPVFRVSLAGYAPFPPTNKTEQQNKLNFQFQPQNNSCNNLLLNQVSEHSSQHPNMCLHTEPNSQPLQGSFCASFLIKLTSGIISFIFPHLHQRFSLCPWSLEAFVAFCSL